MFGIRPKDDMEQQIADAKKHRQEYDELYYGHYKNHDEYSPDDYNTDNTDTQDTDFDTYEPSEECMRERHIIKILMIIMILSVMGGIIIKQCKHKDKYDTIAFPSVNEELTSEETNTTIPAETTNTDIENDKDLYDKEKYSNTITDTINYRNLTPEKTYKISYRIFDYDKETQEVISERTAIAEFTPKESDGTINIAIPCTLSEYESIIDDSQDISSIILKQILNR